MLVCLQIKSILTFLPVRDVTRRIIELIAESEVGWDAAITRLGSTGQQLPASDKVGSTFSRL